MNLRHVLACGLILMVGQPAFAYIVKGNVQCPELLKEDTNETFRQQNKWWALGYVSAMNRMNHSSRARDVDSDTIYGKLLDYCRAHPEDDIDDATYSVYQTLQ